MLRRDLDRPLPLPAAKVPISVRAAGEADHAAIVALLAELSGTDRTQRERFLQLPIGTCYVAADGDADICYMQWLVGPDHNDVLAAHTNLPRLEHGEALLENAFTPAAHRGKGIMSAAMAQIAAHGADLGARFVLTVVREANAASLKGCVRAGFEPYMLKLDGWRMLHRDIRYTDLPPEYVLPGL